MSEEVILQSVLDAARFFAQTIRTIDVDKAFPDPPGAVGPTDEGDVNE